MNSTLNEIVRQTAHRTWLPAGPWVMAQTWRDLLFAHWPIAPAIMRSLIPPSLELDTFGGEAWLGVVPFRMTGVRPRWLPAGPWLSHFAELNVRTYISMTDRGVVKPGVFFFSLDAANPLAVQIARSFFMLPYFNAQMMLLNDGDAVHYLSRRTHRNAPAALLSASYRPTGAIYQSQPASIDQWLTERYALYTVDRAGHPMIGEIHHLPWPLQPAQADLSLNSMAQAAGITLPEVAPILHFARSIDVAIWPLRRVETTEQS
jgi:uncharacterized protein YqjF (DUF2071 family)